MTNNNMEGMEEGSDGIQETKVEMDAFQVGGEVFPFRSNDPEARKRAREDAQEYIKSQREN